MKVSYPLSLKVSLWLVLNLLLLAALGVVFLSTSSTPTATAMEYPRLLTKPTALPLDIT